jgi:hypothetical protein
MAPPQPITIIDPLPWPRSTATRLALSELVTVGQLAANEAGRPAAWIEPPTKDREPNPPYGYVVSFIRFHERGFAAPASLFMRALCYHYGVELHNFTPNRDFAGGDIRRHVRGLPGDPSERRRRPPSYSGKVLMEKADSWHNGVSPSSHQAWLDSLLAALKAQADDGLTAGCVLANLHHRRIVP